LADGGESGSDSVIRHYVDLTAIPPSRILAARFN
jgi:hypothetical protein